MMEIKLPTGEVRRLSPMLFWIDLEMTGLDANRDIIIEIASMATDNELNIIAEGPSLVIKQPDERLEAMDEWNKTQHGASGLIEAVKKSTISLESACVQTLAFAQSTCDRGITPVCGNSVYQDRNFLRVHMPELDAYFSYRIIDVSTVKERP